MSSNDLRSRFLSEYQGDIKDPILTTLLDTIDSYQADVKDQLLLTTYAQRSDQVSDGLFEVLRRHLFGQMFPGPAFVLLQASLREVETAHPIRLEQFHYFSVQDQEGEQILFAAQHPTWIVPAQSNDVKLEVYGDDIMLGFSIINKNLAEAPDGFVSIYFGESDPLLVEKMRSRLPKVISPDQTPPTVLRKMYPGRHTFLDEFFHTPFEHRYLKIPFEVFTDTRTRRGADGTSWIPFQGIGRYAEQLQKRLSINTFTAWNMVEGEATGIPTDSFRWSIQITNHTKRQTMIVGVRDLGSDPATEYVDAAVTMDPAFPFQFTSTSDIHRDEILLAMTPPATGEVKVRYYQYDLSDLCVNIASGRSFSLYKGIDERLRSLQSVTPTQRINAMNDKLLVWNYFRSLLASRNRWLTKDDLRSAVLSYPPFGGNKRIVKSDKIGFEEKVGRVRGFLTPFTEISVPVNDRSLLADPDRSHFERQLGLYFKQRTVNGNFIRVRLFSAEEV